MLADIFVALQSHESEEAGKKQIKCNMTDDENVALLVSCDKCKSYLCEGCVWTWQMEGDQLQEAPNLCMFLISFQTLKSYCTKGTVRGAENVM